MQAELNSRLFRPKGTPQAPAQHPLSSALVNTVSGVPLMSAENDFFAGGADRLSKKVSALLHPPHPTPAWKINMVTQEVAMIRYLKIFVSQSQKNVLTVIALGRFLKHGVTGNLFRKTCYRVCCLERLRYKMLLLNMTIEEWCGRKWQEKWLQCFCAYPLIRRYLDGKEAGVLRTPAEQGHVVPILIP